MFNSERRGGGLTMNKSLKANISILVLLVLSACQSMPARDSENTSSIKNINIPGVSTAATVEPNDLMFTNINHISAIVMRPKETVTIQANMPMMNHQVTVNPSTIFFKGKDSNGNTMICSIGPTLKPTIGQSQPFCLVEGDTKNLFNRVQIGRGFAHVPVYAPKVPNFIEDEILFNPNGPTKREIYFNKVENDNLFFTYKEYKDKQVIKTEPLIYPVQSPPFVLKIREAEFSITKVGKNIEFSVSKEMPNTIGDETMVNCVNKNSGLTNVTKVKICAVVYGIAFPL